MTYHCGVNPVWANIAHKPCTTPTLTLFSTKVNNADTDAKNAIHYVHNVIVKHFNVSECLTLIKNE